MNFQLAQKWQYNDYLTPSLHPEGGGALPYLTRQDVTLNRVSFYVKNYATGCPYLTKIMRQGIVIGKEIMRQGIVIGKEIM